MTAQAVVDDCVVLGVVVVLVGIDGCHGHGVQLGPSVLSVVVIVTIVVAGFFVVKKVIVNGTELVVTESK